MANFNFNTLKNAVKNVTNSAMSNVNENKPTLLMYGGVIGVVGVAASAVSGTLKAKEVYDAAEGKVTKKVAFEMAKCFIPLGIATAGTLLCVVGVHKEYIAKAAALAAMHAVDSKGLESVIGAKATNKVIPCNESVEAMKAEGKVKIYDEYCSRYIETTIAKIEEAKDEVNEEFITFSDRTSGVPASYFYEKLTDGYYVPDAVDGKYWFRDDGALRIKFDSVLDENMNPVLSFSFDRDPETEITHSC